MIFNTYIIYTYKIISVLINIINLHSRNHNFVFYVLRRFWPSLRNAVASTQNRVQAHGNAPRKV